MNDHRLIINLPERLDFEENYEQTASHFALIREAVTKKQTIASLGFENIRYISPSAALVLASEVDRWNQRIAGRLQADVHSWDDAIARLLCQMGYFELLKLDKPKKGWASASTSFLPFKRGHISDHGGGTLAKQLRIEIEALLGQEILRHFLFEGLSEAITNVGQHAYRADNPFSLKQWWLSASFDSESRHLCVTFYDQGEGIPQTLPRAYFFERIKDAFNKWRDSEKIEAAMEIGRTTSNRPERGKGLQNLVEFARAHREGQLSIYSLTGMYRQKFVAGPDEVKVEMEKRDSKNSIGGTLIEWAVTI